MKTTADYFAGAASFDAMADASVEYGPLLRAQRDRAVVPADLVARVEALGSHWRLLTISEDWCIDSQSIVPVVAAFAEATPNLELRCVTRDGEPALMDAHLTNGVSRAIPVVIAIDADGQERAWWGSRPAPLKAKVAEEWKAMEKPERNKEVRRWYAIDKGRTTLEEIVAMLEQVAAAQPASATAGA